MTTLAEDLVLLLVDPAAGRIVVDSVALDRGIAGALLLDLALRERLAVQGQGRRVRISVVNPAPTGEPVVDVALAELGGSPVRAQRAVELVAGKAREAVFGRLEQRGLAHRHRHRRWGVLPATRWEVAGVVVRDRLRAGLERVLVHGQPPDVRLACLVSLLHAVRAEHRVVDGPARVVRARAAEIAADELIGTAVRGAVVAIRTAVLLHRPLATGNAQSRPPSFS